MRGIDLCVIAACAAVSLTACTDTCRGDGPDPRRGAGGGPVGPGWGGGFGDDANGAHNEAPVSCAASNSMCQQDCREAAEADTAQCAGLSVPAQQQTCAEAAQARLSGCSAGCPGAGDDDPVERCRQECDREYEERNAICRKKKKSERRKCWEDSTYEYGECLKKCK